MVLRLQRRGGGTRLVERLLGLLAGRLLALERRLEALPVAPLLGEGFAVRLGALALLLERLAGLVELRAKDPELPRLLLQARQERLWRQVGVNRLGSRLRRAVLALEPLRLLLPGVPSRGGAGPGLGLVLSRGSVRLCILRAILHVIQNRTTLPILAQYGATA